MLSLLAFIAGALMFIKGNFRLLNRMVSKRDGRFAGLILMAPFVLEVCMLFSLSFSMVSDSMVVDENGSVSISADVFDAYSAQVENYSNLFLGAMLLAVVAAGVIVWRSPQIDLPSAPMTSAPPSNSPAVNNPPPAKSKREHPLGGYGVFSPAPPPPSAAPKSIMTVAEAAAYIGQTPADVEMLIDQNRLPAAKGNGGYRIARSALDDFLNGEL